MIQITGEVPLTADQYDQVNETLGISGSASDIDGLICHTACVTDSGMLITDVWESQDKFDRFMNERLMPAFQQVGVGASGPQPTIQQVHNHLH